MARRYEAHEQSVLDRYTVGHAAVGLLCGLAQLPWWGTVTVAIGWELVENPLKDAFPELFPDARHDRYANAAADATAMLAAYALTRAYMRRSPP